MRRFSFVLSLVRPGTGTLWTGCRCRYVVRALMAVAVLHAVGCGSPEDEVRQAWTDYQDALRASDVSGVRSLLAAGEGAELDGPGAVAALELRSALLPASSVIRQVDVSGDRVVLAIEGAVDQQSVRGRVTFIQESGSWKLLREEWNVDLVSSFPVPDVELARIYAAEPASPPQIVLAIDAHEGAVTAAAFTRDGQRIVSIGYDDYRLCLWDATTGKLLDRVDNEDRPSDLAMLADGSAAYVVDARGRVTGWPIEAGAFGKAQVLAGRAGRTARIAVAADGQTAVTTSWDDPAKLWDLTAGTFVRALPGSDRMRGVAFSPVGSMLACGSQADYFAVWKLDWQSRPEGSQKKYRVPRASAQSDVRSVAFSPDGRRLATGHMDSSISVWDMEKGRQIHNWYVPDSSVMEVEFSPGGTVLASAQEDGSVRLWEARTRRQLFRLGAHEGAALSVAFNPADGVTLATGGEDGAIRIWR